MHKKVVAVILALFVAISGVMYPYRAKAYAGALVGLALGGLLVACGLTFMTTEDLNRAVASVQNWFTPDDIFTLETALEGGSYDANGNYNFDAPLTTFTKVQAYAATFVDDGGNGTGVFSPNVYILPGTATDAGTIVFDSYVGSDAVYSLGTYNGVSYSLVTGEAGSDGMFEISTVLYMNGHTISKKMKTRLLSSVTVTPAYVGKRTTGNYESLYFAIRGEYADGAGTGYLWLADPFGSATTAGLENHEINGVRYTNYNNFFADYGLTNTARYCSSIGTFTLYWGSICHDLFYKPYKTETPIDVLIDSDYLLGEKSALGKDVIGLISDYVAQNIDAGVYINGNTVTGELADVLNPADSISVSIPQTMDKVQEATADDILTDTSTVPVNPPSDLPLPEIPRNIFTDKFPFCLPFDLYNAFVGLVATPTPPKFVMPMEIGGWLDEDITIDFEPFTPLALICKWGLSVVFVIALIKISRKMIGAQ